MRLQGKTAIITGGGSGFGAGIAKKFVAEGCRVMLADRNKAAANTVALELGEAALPCRADVTVAADTEDMIGTARDLKTEAA